MSKRAIEDEGMDVHSNLEHFLFFKICSCLLITLLEDSKYIENNNEEEMEHCCNCFIFLF